MTNRKLITLFIIFTALLSSGVVLAQSKDELAVSVLLDRDTIGLDEQATLIVEVSGASQNLPQPQLPTLAMFEVYSQGRSSNISIVNGQVTSSATYRYLLLPTKAGTFPINQIAVVSKNKRYKGNEVELTVLNKGVSVSPHLSEKAQTSKGQSRDYFLEAVVDMLLHKF